MHIEDLESLKLAIDTNNPSLFHGHWEDALSEVVDELLEFKSSEDDQLKYEKYFKDAQSAVQSAMEYKSHIMDECEGRKRITIEEMEAYFEETLDLLAGVL
jgi:hypothetical protein